MGKLENFTIPDGEEPYYYSTTVEDGKIVRHDGDPEHAVYKSVIAEIQRRAELWHRWAEINFPDAYDGIGVIEPSVYAENYEVMRQFMEGEREE